MKSTSEIQEIKTLLSRFYQGETSPAEELALYEYFNGDVADDLADDARVFAALHALQPKDVAVPDDLEGKILEIFSDESATSIDKTLTIEKKPTSLTKRLKIFLYSAIAAAAALLVGVVIYKGLTSPKDIDPLGAPLLADNQVPVAVELPRDSGIVVIPVPSSRMSKPVASGASAAAQTSTLPQSDEALYAGYEVTDPEEAAKIMEQLSRLLARSLGESTEAVAVAELAFENTIDRYNSLIYNPLTPEIAK